MWMLPLRIRIDSRLGVLLLVVGLGIGRTPDVLANTLGPPDVYDYLHDLGGLFLSGGGTLPAIAVAASTDNTVYGQVTFTGCAITAGSGLSSPCGLAANPAGPVTAIVLQQSDEQGVDTPISGVAQLRYSVQVNGPTASNIPLIAGGSMLNIAIDSLNGGSGDSTGAYGLYDSTQGTDLIDENTCAGKCGGVNTTQDVIDFNQLVVVNTGDILNVTMYSSASLHNSMLEEAMIDPYFEIDPAFADAGEYSIQISPGVGNSVPQTIPEPPSSVLFCTAMIGLLGIRSRRA